jgi:hypothetical protein
MTKEEREAQYEGMTKEEREAQYEKNLAQAREVWDNIPARQRSACVPGMPNTSHVDRVSMELDEMTTVEEIVRRRKKKFPHLIWKPVKRKKRAQRAQEEAQEGGKDPECF